MAILVHQCPHCTTDRISLAVVAGSPGPKDHWWSAHLLCPKCKKPSAAILTYAGGGTMHEVLAKAGDPTDAGWDVFKFWPTGPAPEIPELLPPDIVRIYLQAERNFPMEGNEEAAGTMYRKALDIGLKKIDPTASGTLGAKIKKLATAGKLTVDIGTWSDNVRDIGNDAAHEEAPITRDELIDLRNFTEMVLTYLFTLPNKVKRRRGEKLDWETTP